ARVHNGGNFEEVNRGSSPAEREPARGGQLRERINDRGVERASARRDEESERLSRAERGAVRALAGHRDERVGEAEDAGAQRDLSGRELVWVAGPVPALVVRA